MIRKKNRLKRLRKRASVARKEVSFVEMKEKSLRDEAFKQLNEAKSNLGKILRENSRLQSLVENSNNLAAFRVHVERAQPFRSDKVFQINVAFDVRALEIGFGYGFRGDVFDLSSHLHHITEELRYKIEKSIRDELTKNGVLNRHAI